MTLAQRKRFMRELTAAVLKDALTDAANMPEEWDGHELRRFLADYFDRANITLRDGPRVDPGYRKRLRAYKNEVASRNLGRWG